MFIYLKLNRKSNELEILYAYLRGSDLVSYKRTCIQKPEIPIVKIVITLKKQILKKIVNYGVKIVQSFAGQTFIVEQCSATSTSEV